MTAWLLLWACSAPPEETPQPPPLDPHPPATPPPPAARPAPVEAGSSPGGSFHLAPTLELQPTDGPARNLLIISLDTVRADRLGVYGGPAETPTLTALAAQGTRFDAAMTQFPETCLSHWSMLTGVLPEVHGNAPAHAGSRYLGPTLAELAAHAGYATAAFIGGVTLQDSVCGLARGFGVYDDQFPIDPTDMRRPGREVTRAATTWIEAQERPWFAFVHYFDAHFPYTPAPPWDTRYDPDYRGRLTGSDVDLRPYRDGGEVPTPRDLAHVLALYDGELSELDAAIAPLIAAVGADTVVVVTSDHGESFEHGYYFNHRDGLWDDVLHVPWIVRAPGVTAGGRVAAQVGLVDLAPTVAVLAGLPLDARMQGTSRVPELEGTRTSGEDMHYALTDPWRPLAQFAARTPTSKVIWTEESAWVYDLRNDPVEEAPREAPPDSFAGVRQAYRDRIEALAPHRGEAPQQDRFISEEEAARLEALGYADRDPPPREEAPPAEAPER